MRMNILVNLFCLVWLTGAALGGIAIFQKLSTLEFNLTTLLALSMSIFVFGYGLMMASFKCESTKSKKFLAELLEAEELSWK